MNQKRVIAAALMLIMLLAASAALAAGAATKVPTIRLTNIPRRGIESGRTNDVGVNASVPGFLTLWLTDAAGNTIRTYYEGVEIHSKINYFNISAYDDNGNKIPEGTYTLNATMVNQYGTEPKKPATARLKIRPTDEDDAAITSGLLTADAAQALGYTTAPAVSQTEQYLQQAPAQAGGTSPVQVTVTSEMTYAAGSAIMVGVEGYQIGVGVSDRAQDDGSYWSLPEHPTDAELWAALTRPITSVNIDEKESSYIYDSPQEGRKQLGTISGLSQGVHVVAQRDDGWSLVEAYRNEDSAFVRGYIKTSRLKTLDVNTAYGIVIDKATQTLTVFMNGQRVGSCLVCTGLATPRYLSRETPAGEFMTVTRRGTVEYYGTDDWCRYTIRINGNYSLAEIPTTKKGGSDYSPMLSLLGMRSTRGNVVIAHDPSMDGGINAEWIWNMTDKNKKVKVLILDDKPRSSVPVAQ